MNTKYDARNEFHQKSLKKSNNVSSILITVINLYKDYEIDNNK